MAVYTREEKDGVYTEEWYQVLKDDSGKPIENKYNIELPRTLKKLY